MSCSTLEEKVETAALDAAIKASHETFERIYRAKKEWLKRPQAEVAVEIKARQTENAERMADEAEREEGYKAALANVRKLRVS